MSVQFPFKILDDNKILYTFIMYLFWIWRILTFVEDNSNINLAKTTLYLNVHVWLY